ncbi:MAG: hypothetical protein LBG65_04640 [Puniceicoccales bacterium]|nr:hypothetical protein [Puniceicoccales bacterium]
MNSTGNNTLNPRFLSSNRLCLKNLNAMNLSKNTKIAARWTRIVRQETDKHPALRKNLSGNGWRRLSGRMSSRLVQNAVNELSAKFIPIICKQP